MPSRSRGFVCCGSEEHQKAGMKPWQSKTGGNLRHKHRSKLSRGGVQADGTMCSLTVLRRRTIKNPAFSWRNKTGLGVTGTYLNNRVVKVVSNKTRGSAVGVRLGLQANPRAVREMLGWFLADAHMQMQTMFVG
jgi:hypothetical protein